MRQGRQVPRPRQVHLAHHLRDVRDVREVREVRQVGPFRSVRRRYQRRDSHRSAEFDEALAYASRASRSPRDALMGEFLSQGLGRCTVRRLPRDVINDVPRSPALVSVPGSHAWACIRHGQFVARPLCGADMN